MPRRKSGGTESRRLLLISSSSISFPLVCFSSILFPFSLQAMNSQKDWKNSPNMTVCLCIFLLLVNYLPLSVAFSALFFCYNCLILFLIHSLLCNHWGGQWRHYKPSTARPLIYGKQLHWSAHRQSFLSAKFIYFLTTLFLIPRSSSNNMECFKNFFQSNTLSIMCWKWGSSFITDWSDLFLLTVQAPKMCLSLPALPTFTFLDLLHFLSDSPLWFKQQWNFSARLSLFFPAPPASFYPTNFLIFQLWPHTLSAWWPHLAIIQTILQSPLCAESRC